MTAALALLHLSICNERVGRSFHDEIMALRKQINLSRLLTSKKVKEELRKDLQNNLKDYVCEDKDHQLQILREKLEDERAQRLELESALEGAVKQMATLDHVCFEENSACRGTERILHSQYKHACMLCMFELGTFVERR